MMYNKKFKLYKNKKRNLQRNCNS